MPNTSVQLATLIASLYASSGKTVSATTYTAQAKKAQSPQKRAAYLGKTVASTTQAVTHALVAAGLSGARGVAEAGLSASGLSLLCSLPNAIDALSSLGLSKSGMSTKELYQESTLKSHAAAKALKTSLLVTGPTKHDNIARLLFNLPLETIQDNFHHDLFPEIEKKLIKQKRGDAIAFFKKCLATDDARKTLMHSFNTSLATYDNPSMPPPHTSLAEVACFLSLLDPDKDKKEIEAISGLFKDMLLQFRSALKSDDDCASALDESNNLLLNMMVTTYTGRAHRKKVQAKNLKIGKNVLTGTGIILSGVLAVHTAGLSLPATALLVGKVSSTSISLLSTATRIAQMVQEGHAAEEIADLLSPEVINALEKTNMAGDLLQQSLSDSQAYDKSLLEMKKNIKSLSRETYHEIIKIKDDPMCILLHLEKEELLLDVLHEDNFLSSVNDKIRRGISVPEIYRLMLDEISRDPALPGTHAFSVKRGKIDLLNVITSFLFHEDKIIRGAFTDCAHKGSTAMFIKGSFEKERSKAVSLHAQKNSLETKYNTLETLEKSIDQQQRLIHMEIGLFKHQPIPDSSIGKLLKANQYIDAVEKSKENISAVLKKAHATIKVLDSGTIKEDVTQLSPL